MIKKVKKMVWAILRKLSLAGSVQLVLESALTEEGWFKSFNQRNSTDALGKSVPWCTYAFNHFIEPRLQERFNIFEFGSGNSTKWYAARVHSVTSVEHNKTWFELIKNAVPSNVSVNYAPASENGEYANFCKNTGKQYDLIIVDGIDRNNCIYQSVHSLSPDGVLVLDNSERTEYTAGKNFLHENGFKVIDFTGLGPGIAYNSTTSIFYKADNCLSI
jgi:hypothetical protein